MDHWCKVPELANFTADCQKHLAIPFASGSEYDRCKMFDQNYSSFTAEDCVEWERPTDYQTLQCSSWMFDQSVCHSNMVNEWELVCSKSWQVDFVSTAGQLGPLFGSFVGGIVSDRFGRVKAFSMGMLFKIAGGFMSTYAPNYPVLVVARVLLGWGSSQTYVSGFVLILENVGSKHRSWMGIAYAAFFSIGFALVAGFAYAVRDWRELQLIMTVPFLIYLVTAWFLPESPRWLVSNGKFAQAERGIDLMAQVNKRHLPEDFDIHDIKLQKEDPRRGNILDLFRTPKLRKYTLIQFVIWFSVNLTYYALSLNAGSLAGDVFLNTAILGLVEIPACLLTFIAMGTKFCGRKKTVGGACIISGVASLICVPVILVYGNSVVVTVLAMIGKAGATGAFNGVFVFTSEIYPTEIRNLGLGSCSTVARISGIAAPYIGGLFGDLWGPLPSLIFGVVGTASGILTFFLPETYGKTLPDTVEELERSHKTGKAKASSENGTVQLPDTNNATENKNESVKSSTNTDTSTYFDNDAFVLEKF